MFFFPLLGSDVLSTAEKWATSGITILLGLGTTFVVLALLIGMILLLRLILQQSDKLSPVVKTKISSLFKKIFKNKKKEESVVVAEEPVSDSEAVDEPIDESTLEAIREAVLGYVQKDGNTVIIQSIARADASDKQQESPSCDSSVANTPKQETATVAGNGNAMKAPMPGTILKIKVSNGASVKKDQVVFVLEAMKMENDIVAPCDGTFTATVAEGTKVNTGDIIAEIK